MAMRRRTILVVGVATLAGCLGDGDDENDDDAEHRGPMAGDVPISSGFPIRLYEADSGDIGPDLHWHGRDGDVTSHWHRSPLEVAVDTAEAYEVVVHNPDGEPYAIGEDVDVAVAPLETDYFIATLEADELTIAGEDVGQADLTFTVVGDGGDWETPSLSVAVSE